MTDRPSPALGRRAVIIGASMAGLLAARVLAERFDEVVLLERDELPDGPAPRKGTPQAIMAHGLLARGAQVLDELFPGFTDALVARGATRADLQGEVAFEADGMRMDATRLGITGLGASRLAIEAELRRRVMALPGVKAITGVDVIAPVLDSGQQRVLGVRCLIWPRDGDDATKTPGSREGYTLSADLTLDCSGRGSRSSTWLRAWGYAPPEEERVEVGIGYVGGYFGREGALAYGQGIGRAAVIRTATRTMPWPGVLIAQEPDAGGAPRWVVALGGYLGDHPEPTLDGLRRRARQLGLPEIERIVTEGELIGEVTRYRFPYSVRRHFERLQRFPQGYLVMGDAFTSFNPIYGQGMTVAACQAVALREALAGDSPGLARRFFAKAAKVVDTPWQLAVGADLAIDCVPGPRPLAVRLVNAYVARLYRAAVVSPPVARAFLKVMHLLEPPATLFAPGVAWRVWRHGRSVQAPSMLAAGGSVQAAEA